MYYSSLATLHSRMIEYVCDPSILVICSRLLIHSTGRPSPASSHALMWIYASLFLLPLLPLPPLELLFRAIYTMYSWRAASQPPQRSQCRSPQASKKKNLPTNHIVLNLHMDSVHSRVIYGPAECLSNLPPVGRGSMVANMDATN